MSVRQTLSKANLNFLTVRLAGVDLAIATEMIRRKCFRNAELAKLYNALAKFPEKSELASIIFEHLNGNKLDPQPAWLAALANGDRQLAIHAVINASMTDAELEKLNKLMRLQAAGHMQRQVLVAIELEQNRRKIGGKRASGNRITTR